jgi:hypothetical protein
MQYGIDPFIRALNEIVDSILSNGIPTLANSLKQPLIGLLICPHFIELRIMLMDPLFELCPKVFNWIQIGTIWWPFELQYTLILKPFLTFLAVWIRALSCMNVIPNYYIQGN